MQQMLLKILPKNKKCGACGFLCDGSIFAESERNFKKEKLCGSCFDEFVDMFYPPGSYTPPIYYVLNARSCRITIEARRKWKKNVREFLLHKKK